METIPIAARGNDILDEGTFMIYSQLFFHDENCDPSNLVLNFF